MPPVCALAPARTLPCAALIVLALGEPVPQTDVRPSRHRSSRRAAFALGVAATLAGCGATADTAAAPEALAVPAAFGGTSVSTATASWNPNVKCSATVTTLATVLGSQKSAQGGATFAGGGFRPGIPDRRSLTPPCAVDGRPTFVELRRVMVAPCDKINRDGDWTCTVRDPARPDGLMNRMHIETDAKFRSRTGWTQPPGKTLIDVQGFVFWDPGHTGSTWHNYSGWELHSFTAWRRSG